MAKRIKLTQAAVDRLKHSGGADRDEVADDVVSGLWLRISATGQKSWALRARIAGGGKPVRITLGDAAVVPLADARNKASELLTKTRAGKDPRHDHSAKRDEASDLEFTAVAKRFMAEYVARKHARPHQTATLFRLHITPRLKGRSLAEIKRADIRRVVDEVDAATSGHTANLALAYLRKMMNWARDEELVEGVPSFNGLSCRTESRDRVLSLDEVRVIAMAMERVEYPFRPIFQLLLMTAQRRGEVAEMRWDGLDLDRERVWSMKASETKADRAHVVPLVPDAAAILSALPRIDGCPIVFSTTGDTAPSGFTKAKMNLDREAAKIAAKEGVVVGQWRIHDLRRTAATYMADALGVPIDTVADILNHSPRARRGITSVYARGNGVFAKRKALAAWARLIAILTGDNAALRDRVQAILRPMTEADAVRLDAFRAAIASADDAAWRAYLATLAAAPSEKAA